MLIGTVELDLIYSPRAEKPLYLNKKSYKSLFLIGIFNSILFALLLGVPTLRLRADYLAIVTIAFAEIVRQVARSATFNDSLGGSDGITGKFGKEFFDLNPFCLLIYQLTRLI